MGCASNLKIKQNKKKQLECELLKIVGPQQSWAFNFLKFDDNIKFKIQF